MRIARIRTPQGVCVAAETDGTYLPLSAEAARPYAAVLAAAELDAAPQGKPIVGELLAPVQPGKIVAMTAILVVAILAVFEPQIKAAISAALDSVTGSK